MAHRRQFILIGYNAKYITEEMWDRINDGRIRLKRISKEAFKIKNKWLDVMEKEKGKLK